MAKYTLVIIFILCYTLGMTQVCDFPLPPSNTCQNAPLICDLDGYCSNNGSAQNSGTPNAFCGVVENNNWVSFIAGSTSFEIKITVENCNMGAGLQAQFFETSDCQNFTTVSNCIDPVTTSETLIASGMNIGQVYYLMMDGKGGDICDYTYELLSGTTLSPAEAVIEDAGFLCEEETLILDGSASASGTGVTYLWSTIDGNIIGTLTDPIVATDTPGTYQIQVEDEGGCKDTTEITIIDTPLAQVEIETPEILDCLMNVSIDLEGEETIGLPSVAYAWTTTNGNITSNAEMQLISVDAPGMYTLVVTNLITGCTEEASVEVFTSISTPVANAGSDQELNCLNATVTLNGALSSQGSSFTFEWTTVDGRIISGTNTDQVVADLPGTYVLSVTNVDNDCVDIDEVIVIDNPAVPESAGFQIINPCYGENFGVIRIDTVIGGTAPFLYAIDTLGFGGQNEFRSLAPGNYDITIQDATGCIWDTIIQIQSQPELVVDLGADEFTQLGCVLDVEAQINFLPSQIDTLTWQSTASCPGCYVQQDTLLQNTLYSLTVTDLNGCTDSDEKIVYVQKERLIFIPNVFTPNGDGINDLFIVHGGKGVQKIKTFRVFNRWGATLFERNNFDPNDPSNGWDGRLKNEEVSNGVCIYFAEVEFIDGHVEIFKGDVALMR